VKRLSFLAILAAFLASGSLLADFPPADPTIAESFPPLMSGAPLLGNPGVWGRVNPGFYGNPTVSFASDVVVLQRQAPHSQEILLDGSLQPLLNASALGTSSQAGGRVNLTFFENNGWDFMFEGLFMGAFQSQQKVDASNGVTLFFYNGVAADPVNTVWSRSILDSEEFNLRRRLNPYFALLGGLRALQLNENLNFGLAGTPNDGYFSQTSNGLFGGQLGFEAVIPTRGYGRFFGTAKYGIYDNHFKVSAQATSGGSVLRISPVNDMAATVGDFTAGYEVQTFPCCTLRIGYQALWIQGAALSVDQLNQYDIFSGQGSVHKGNPLYQGWFLGLIFVF
jgi:hypothetical protein